MQQVSCSSYEKMFTESEMSQPLVTKCLSKEDRSVTHLNDRTVLNLGYFTPLGNQNYLPLSFKVMALALKNP